MKEGSKAVKGKEQEKDKLQTEPPISEKDEVKQAEERTAQSHQNNDSSVAADVKNREHK